MSRVLIPIITRSLPLKLRRWPPLPVVMTEKDAVKCAAFAGADHWFLAVDAELDAEFCTQFDAKVATLRQLTTNN